MNTTLQIKLLQILILYLLGYWFVQLNEPATGHPETTLPQRFVAQTPSFQNAVKIVVQGYHTHIISNGIPNHPTGIFPNAGNPNRIMPQKYAFQVPTHPQLATKITPLRGMPFGVALNGVPFDPGTAEFWNNDPRSGWHYEALSGKINLGIDHNHAHVQPSGAYHYHGVPVGLVSELGKGQQMTHIGYAADGFPIYAQYGYRDANLPNSGIQKMHASYRLKSGQRSSGPGGTFDGIFVEDYEYVANAGDLDECNGRFGVTPEYPQGIYHYYVTEKFPFIPRCFRGIPDPSFRRPVGGPPLSPPRPRNRF